MSKKFTDKQWVDFKMDICELCSMFTIDNKLWVSLLDGFLLQILRKKSYKK